MGKSLIITEKPSVAQEFAKVLHVSGRKDGYIENQDYVISWCVGHLVGMVYPESYDMKYKKWKLEDLPFLPKEYKYDVIKDVEKQYNIVHELLHREDIDKVYWAGDAGKEGQTIEENIRNFGGVREGMEELRVWIDSQTEEEILRGIREAKPMSEYANLGKSGIMRTIEDYAMGINFSRVMSVKYGNLVNSAAGTNSYTAIAVGRVMTCVLGMVVIREREIRNFKETPFYRVIGKFTDADIEAEWKSIEGSKYFESPLLYKENGFKEEKDALALIDELNGKKASGSEKLVEGDVIKIFMADETIEKFKGQTKVPTKSKINTSTIRDNIVYEDENILIVNKPVGVLSQKAKPTDVSINEMFIEYLLEDKKLTYTELETFTPSVCNRLDRNTSGLITFGKTLIGVQELSNGFKLRTFDKYYLAVVWGEITESCHIDGYLSKDTKTNKVTIKKTSKEDSSYIQTAYEPLKTAFVLVKNKKIPILVDKSTINWYI